MPQNPTQAPTQANPQARPRILIIFNPTAGQRRQHLLALTVQELLKKQWDVTLKPTHHAGDGAELAKMAVRDKKYALICAAGGDGTINEVVGGLLQAKGYTLPLGIIPLGTANVLANELGYGKTPAQWAKSLTQLKTQQVYVGELKTKATTRAFICMAGVGFDAAVVESVNSKLKKKIGKGAYIWRSLQLLLNLKQTDYHTTIDGKDHGTAQAIVACNGHFYGGRFVLAPKAKLTDDSLYFALFSGRGVWAVVRLMVALALGKAPTMQGMRLIKGKELIIKGGEGDPIQADGDNAAKLPATFRLIKETLTVVKP